MIYFSIYWPAYFITTVTRSCGLPPYRKDRYPHEFSGGQRQRIRIARAGPEAGLHLCDETVSALDVSIQAWIINLLSDLQKQFGMACLFISRSLSVVEHIADSVGVMSLGTMVEYAEKRELFKNPPHPHTRALFSAVPLPDPTVKTERILLKGSIPSPANPPSGCKFHTRCPNCTEICSKVDPTPVDGGGRMAACHLYHHETPDRLRPEEDDGRVIADMERLRDPGAPGVNPENGQASRSQVPSMSRVETRSFVISATLAGLRVAAVLSLAVIGLVPICQFVWFR